MVAPYVADRAAHSGMPDDRGTSECPPLSYRIRTRSTNAIESINARIRRAVKARGHFPSDAAAMKCVYLAVMSLDPTGRGRQRWTNRWKPALNASTIAFPGRIIQATK